MKKITDFIVEKRNIFLILFILLSGISLYLSSNVNINEDIMKYLPETSETKIGNDIMNKEFIKQDSSTLNVMFKDLSEEEKLETLNKLKNIKGVSSVKYENNENYNIDEYTLFILNVDDYADSTLAKNVYKDIEENYKFDGMSGDIYDANKPVLHTSIVLLAITCAMIILIILSESYIEPFLYLITIGIAVFINKGTNIIFDSVSSITDSITAILQLALSMDYSIMLSNRFKQEKENTDDKIKAMKNALYQSFKSISSSSVTTIVGLLALIFMSFTIGRDLGLVLSKGVLLSLICIFVCLPALLLIFDKLITKTHKKSPNFNLTKLGKFSYKTRWIQTVVIIVLFVIVYFLQGNTTILYTDSEQDKVGKIFKSTNQIAVVYENKYEDLIASYCKKLEDNQNIDQVLCYSNTINEKLTYDKLNKKLENLGQDTTIDEYLLKLIYYNYHSDKSNLMTIDEFITFIKSNIYSNEEFNNSINEEIKENLDLLSKFSNPTEINKQRTIDEISSILGIDKSDAANILIYYNSKNKDTKMTIKEFVDFMLNDVANNQDYNGSLDKNTISKLKQLQNFTNASSINKKMNSKELSNTFGIDENLVEQLLLFYNTTADSKTKMTLNTFSNFALEIANDDNYKSLFDTNTINSLTLLKTLSTETFITNNLNSNNMTRTLSNLGLNLSQDSIELLYLLYDGYNTDTKMTLSEFANTALYISNLDSMKQYFTDELKTNLLTIANDTTSTLYSVNELTSALGQDKMLISIVYGFTDKQMNKTMDISIKELINFIYTNKDNPLFTEYINNNLELFNLAYTIVNNTNTQYDYKEISNIINKDEEQIKLIFNLYDYLNNETLLTPLELTNLILNNLNNDLLKNKLDKSTVAELTLVREVMNSTLNNTYYTSSNLSSLLGIDKNTVSLLFSLYNSIYGQSDQNISLYNYVNFIITDVMNNDAYSDKFNNGTKEKLTSINQVMNISLNNKLLNSNDLYNTLKTLSDDLDPKLINLVYLYHGSINDYNPSWEMTVEEFINYLNSNILSDEKFEDFIDNDMKETITDAKNSIDKSKKLIVSDNYSRIVLNTKYPQEDEETFKFINTLESDLGNEEGIYIVGNSSMAVEMSRTFNNELNKITLLTMIFIFVVVAITFKSLLIPLILVLVIQCAVYITMSFISLTGGSVYFISLLIVQAILMGATIDYAIVYTSYYKESRLTMNVKDSIINSYNKSIHTIISSSSILIIVTLIVANFASAIAAKICETISQGAFASVILILLILPGVLASCDKIICKKKN